MNLYEDSAILLNEEGVTITNYRYPGHRRHIPYTSIRHHQLFELGPLTGRYRLVGLGFRRPRHFFHWDRARSSKTHALALDTGRRIHPVISPDDPVRVMQLLDEHAQRLTTGGATLTDTAEL